MITIAMEILLALQEVADAAEVYLYEGTNPTRNRLDNAVQALRKLQKEQYG
jgi:hypothetical protein